MKNLAAGRRYHTRTKVQGRNSVTLPKLAIDAKDAEGRVIQEPPLTIWANFRQRALDTAMLEITKKTDGTRRERLSGREA
jgi:hypothetical protein